MGQGAWALIFWPIFLPAIIAIIICTVWWLITGAKLKQSPNIKKDYSIPFIVGALLFIWIFGYIIYSLSKIPQ